MGDETPFDGNGTTLIPGARQSFGLLNCRDGDNVADRLWILANTDGESGYEIDEFVELEEGDCGEVEGTTIDLAISSGDLVAVRES